MISRSEFDTLRNPFVAEAAGEDTGLTWPTNEIMLRTLLRTGRTPSRIAEMYGVDIDRVTEALRDLDT